MSVFLTKNPVVNVTAYHIGSEPPSNPFRGMVWFDTNYSPARVKFYNGTNWVDVSVDESDKVDGYHASQVPAPNTVVVSGATGVIDDRWLPATVARKTVSPVTIYVDNVNGSDTTGDGSASNPYRTFARALRDVGEFYGANVTIVLKASNVSYGTLDVVGLINKWSYVNLTISGEMIVLDSGVVTDFSNAVNDPVYGSLVQVAQITDDTKSWTTGQWKHKLLRVYKGATSYYRVITDNDATNLYCSYTFPVTIDNTWNYEILDWGTRVDAIYCYTCYRTIFQFLNVVRPSSGYGLVVRDTGYDISFNGCRFEAFYQQNTMFGFLSNSYCTFNYSYANVNDIASPNVFINLLGRGSYLVVIGTIFDKCSNAVIYNNHEYSKVALQSGSRFYKGSINPSNCIELLAGMLIGHTPYGKVLIDAGTRGFSLTRTAYVQNVNSFVFGPNVTIPIASHLGLIDGGRLLVNDYFGIAITNNDYTRLHSRLQVQGSVATQVTTVSANTTLGVNHHIVLVDASGGNRTITLPDATTCVGRQYIIKKIDSSTNTVTISAQAGQTIDGQSSVMLITQYQAIAVVSDGNNWYRISG